MLSRRSLFRLFAAAPVLAEVARPSAASNPPPVSTGERVQIPEIWVSRDRVIKEALMLIGVLLPGEEPAPVELQYCRSIFEQMPGTWWQIVDFLPLHASEVLRYDLARRLAPVFAPDLACMHALRI